MEPNVGKVYLVGAGPGDPGLLTLRGAECLRRADVILYDGLVNPLLLRHSNAVAERTCRVSVRGTRSLDQAEINRRLVDAAKNGKTVVRLKGGDPFIFGRGSEEAAALAAEGIAFEVVPGVTAAVAAGDYAGFSITHRDQASAVAFVTGHEDPSKPSPSLDYSVLAKFPGTLVFYMGLHRLAAIARALVVAGLSDMTPVAVISQATWSVQKTVTSTLKEIVAQVTNAHLRAPSLIVVGECVKQREAIAWFEKRPLFGQRIGVTRADEQSDSLIDQILELGATPVLMPTIEILPPDDWGPVDACIANLGQYDWIVFTSVNGVRSFLGRLIQLHGDIRRIGKAQLAAIGPSTADAIREFHLRASVVPASYRAEELAAALRDQTKDKRVLWVRADRVRDVLRTELIAGGAILDEVVAYRHHDLESWPADVNESLIDGLPIWIGVSSPAIARNVARLIPEDSKSRLGKEIRLVTISPVTTQACHEAGLAVSAEADVHTWNGILDSIVRQSSDVSE